MASTFSQFKKMLGLEKKAGTLASPDDWLVELFGAPAGTTGIPITPFVAMSCAPVRAAVQAIAEPLGQLSVHVYKRNADGSKQRAPDHPFYTLLHDQPNEWTTASTFREQLARDCLLHGNAFAYINRVGGKPIELLRMHPERVMVRIDLNTDEPIYEMAEFANDTRIVSRNDLIHIMAPSIIGWRGESPIRLASDAIGLSLIMERHAARLFANGARPSGLLSLKGNVTVDALTKAKAAWLATQGGVANGGGTAVLPADATWQALTFNSVDSQFLELRKLQIEEIARVFRVPPHMLYELGRATWGNSEQMGQEFLSNTLMPWIKRFEGEFRLKLFAPDERKDYFVEYLTDDLVRADITARYKAYSEAVGARILNPNEARAAENRPPYVGGDEFINPNVQTARLT
jgi:HK97 family phage portal protein